MDLGSSLGFMDQKTYRKRHKSFDGWCRVLYKIMGNRDIRTDPILHRLYIELCIFNCASLQITTRGAGY